MDDRARGVTVADAAVQLGISKEAVRKRIHRGTLSSHRDAYGMVRVSIPPSSTASSTDPELIEAKDETIRVLQEQLEAEREARLRADHIIARLSESNAELSRTVRELEPADRPQEPSEDAAQQPTSKEPEPEPGPSSVGYFGKRFRIVEPPGPGPSPPEDTSGASSGGMEGVAMSGERIPPEEIRRIARHKRRARLEKIRRFVRGLWKGRG